MGVEIERKFLVTDAWQPPGEGLRCVQGYLACSREAMARVRVIGRKGFLTVKGPGLVSRSEWEYEIPVEDAEEMLALCSQRVVEKTRHFVTYEGHIWEVDVFHGDNAGLVTAEVELQSEDESFARPLWLGLDVTADRRYRNSALAEVAYATWKGEFDA